MNIDHSLLQRLDENSSIIDSLCRTYLELQERESKLIQKERDLAEREMYQATDQLQFEERMRQEQEALENNMHRAKMELERCYAKLEEEKEQMKKYQLTLKSGRVKLNVGGVPYETTVETLVKSSRLFANMFSGKWEEKIESDGIFLDRCGIAFDAILMFMRIGAIHLDLTSKELMLIKEEAKYYLMDELVDYLDKIEMAPNTLEKAVLSVVSRHFRLADKSPPSSGEKKARTWSER